MDLSLLLERTIEREYPNLAAVTEEQAGVHPAGQDSWSPKQELGHLIDSAANNHMRFVRAALEPEYHGPGYAQNDWVELHGYQEMPWQSIADFWFRYNRFLAHLIAQIPESRMKALCSIGSAARVTLAFLIEDYVLHMQHHVDHMLKRDRITAYPSAPAQPKSET
ncbi:MAG: DinB family protein [Bryobacteraceae bacterium]|jgi:hypothetical protein